MARTKQVPNKRQASSEFFNKETAAWESSSGAKPTSNGAVVAAKDAALRAPAAKADAGIMQLVIAVSGIYASFLTWAYLQEKLTTTRHGPAQEVWHFPVFLNTIHLASPFGYASLAHIDYISFLLAKSCKLLPVMLLHVAVFRRRYPLHKYLVVAAVTAGVAVFTLHSGSSSKKKSKASSRLGEDANVAWGMLLLGINLLFDGLTNSTQDYIFASFQPYTGPQMMCANNMMSSLVTGAYLLVGPAVLGATGAGEWLGLGSGDAGELGDALAFMGRYPAVWKDVLGFAACGAVGQVFIFYTLSTFSSVLLVTVTVTRKMMTMMLSVLAFGHRLTRMQWLGVGLVFGGIGVEAAIARSEKMAKEAAKKAKSG
ncbi:hypothetical protein LLEC1_03739 [Akanthomyces lecanii]|uniref:UDP-galactose transporter homolog 1 n=1 Tax=Cordyceps confragosa TaxID=2714763 RepID=A0A179IE12_CORDF|nr:hypothetical protein LLEC1_03739 [Akanthomyces lecanii]